MAEREPKTKESIDDPWQDLVISMLSVNQYSLDRAYQLADALRERELFDPKTLVHRNQSEILDRLKSAGYDRGLFMTNLFALRLANLGALIESKGLEACTKVISSGDIRAIENLLLSVNGIGPKVIANYCFLRDIPKR